MANERIKADMTGRDIIMVMGDGDPGGMTVIMNIMQHGGKIDTQDFMGGLGSILTMDTLGIYGSRIWGLYKDVCGEDLVKTIAMLRAYQLGQLAGVTKEALMHGIDNWGEGLDVDAAVAAVKERLPGFNTELAT